MILTIVPFPYLGGSAPPYHRPNIAPFPYHTIILLYHYSSLLFFFFIIVSRFPPGECSSPYYLPNIAPFPYHIITVLYYSSSLFFFSILLLHHPPLPPQVKVLLRISCERPWSGCHKTLSVDGRRRCVTLYDPVFATDSKQVVFLSVSF